MALFVQSFVCLEGPVSENYENELKTIGNPEFPIQETIQSLVDDLLYTLVLTAQLSGLVQTCAYFVFMLVPVPPQGTTHPITANLMPFPIEEPTVIWSSNALEQ